MTPTRDPGSRPRYWTFGEVREDIDERGAAAFWRDVVERHGLLTGWFQDRELYHRIGYLVAIGDSIPDLIEAVPIPDALGVPASLVDRTRQRLELTREGLAAPVRQPKDDGKCTDVLLLMNVETVLAQQRPGQPLLLPRLRRRRVVARAHPRPELRRT